MSSEPWNEFKLTQPPLLTIGISKSKLPLSNLRKTLENAILFYESQKDLEESAAFCSRLLARRKNSFRNFEGYRELRKVNSALCRLLRLDIAEVLKNFFGVLPDFMRTGDFETPLPSQESYDYMLLRLIALQKLFVRITDCCRKSAAYFTKLLNKNFFIEILTVILSTVARTWQISRKIAARTASYYGEFVSNRKHFPLHRATLCEGFVFPDRLGEIVAPEDELTSQLTNYAEKSRAEVMNVTDEQGDSNMKDSATIRITMKSPGASTIMQPPKVVDLGVVVSRDSSGPKTNLKDLRTVEHIMNFIREEDTNRKKSISHCDTKDISDKTWNLLRKKLSKLPTNDNRSAVKLIRNMLGRIS